MKGLLFGAASVTTGVKATSQEKYGELWGVKGITPGAIAFVATVVCLSLCLWFNHWLSSRLEFKGSIPPFMGP